MPVWLVEVVGISAACGIATAPILWLQFGTIPLWTVPANALAEPAMPVLLGCGLGSAALAPLIPTAALALSWIAGLAGAWIAFSARLIAVASRTRRRRLAAARHRHCRGDRLRRGSAGPAAVPSSRHGRHGRRTRPARSRSAGGPCIRRRAGRRRPASGSRSSMSARETGSCSRRREGALLVDAGPPEAHVDRQLRRLGLHRLAALVVSHAHRDHVGGGTAVLRALAWAR